MGILMSLVGAALCWLGATVIRDDCAKYGPRGHCTECICGALFWLHFGCHYCSFTSSLAHARFASGPSRCVSCQPHAHRRKWQQFLTRGGTSAHDPMVAVPANYVGCPWWRGSPLCLPLAATWI